jgi:tripartite-type tricarboxylate transporter receptor subunit TctC
LNKLIMPRRRVLGRALLLSGSALAAPMLASGVARAVDAWPNKPVRYINLFPAGGPTDVLSRIACQKLGELAGQQFVVENKGGSGGNVGADAIAHSTPDGYTIGLMSVSSHAIATSLYARLPFNANKDFTPVTMLWSLPNLLIVRKTLGPKTVPELIAAAKEKPGKISYASHDGASQRRAVRGAGQDRHPARALSRQRAGDAGPPGRPGRHDLRQHPGLAGADGRRQGLGARRHQHRTQPDGA